MSAFPALSWKSRHSGTIQHHRPSKALYGTAHAGYAPGPVAGSTGGGQLPSFLVQGISDQGAPAGSGCFRHGGDFQRILEYPKQGFSTEQPVTPEAMAAFRTLVEAGYGSQLLKGVPFLGILEKTRFLLLLNADCGHQYNPHSQPNYITYHGRQNQHRPRPNGKNREPL